jgi:hypothetical protein
MMANEVPLRLATPRAALLRLGMLRIAADRHRRRRSETPDSPS